MATPVDDKRDMRDILIRLDQKVSDGFANVNAKLDSLALRADGHETRIHALEIDRATHIRMVNEFDSLKHEVSDVDDRLTEIETTGRVTSKIASALWAVCGTGIVALLGWLGSILFK